MIIGFIVVCGYTLGAPQTIEGCRPYTKLFTDMILCEKAANEAEYLDFGENTYVAYHDCRDLGESI